MQNHLIDLNNKLFAIIEELSDPEATKHTEVRDTIARAGAIVEVSNQIISLHKVAMLEADFINNYTGVDGKVRNLPSTIKELSGEGARH